MKKVLLFILVSALLATSITSCKVEPKENESLENEVVENVATEDEVAQDEVFENEVEDEVVEDEITVDEVSENKVVDEEHLQPKYNVIYTPSDEIPIVSPEELIRFCDTDVWRYGYKTDDGQIVIPAIFESADEFSEGLAAVCRKWGGPLEYIDASGKTILTVEGIEGSEALDHYGFYPTCSFNDGVAVIYDSGFCIDKTGNVLNIKNPEGMYKYGLIAVRDPETNLIGYADIDGNIVIPGRYSSVRDFEPQGVALVFSMEFAKWPDGYETRYYGYINTKGEEIIPLEYYAGPNGRTNIVQPSHVEVDGMIELYKDGYYHYFTYDGTLVKTVPDGKPVG